MDQRKIQPKTDPDTRTNLAAHFLNLIAFFENGPTNLIAFFENGPAAKIIASKIFTKQQQHQQNEKRLLGRYKRPRTLAHNIATHLCSACACRPTTSS